jgi:hypothetical protein
LCAKQIRRQPHRDSRRDAPSTGASPGQHAYTREFTLREKRRERPPSIVGLAGFGGALTVAGAGASKPAAPTVEGTVGAAGD